MLSKDCRKTRIFSRVSKKIPAHFMIEKTRIWSMNRGKNANVVTKSRENANFQRMRKTLKFGQRIMGKKKNFIKELCKITNFVKQSQYNMNFAKIFQKNMNFVKEPHKKHIISTGRRCSLPPPCYNLSEILL